MRASDQVLRDALADAQQADLAARAEAGEWNDYFGKHAMNMQHLLATVRARQYTLLADAFAGKNMPDRERIAAITATFEGLVQRVANGDFDATRDESLEWGKSSEGQDVFKDLVGKRK